MADEKQETRLQWWMRYVVVPLVGGGGAIALVAAYIGRPPVSPAPAQQPTVNTSPQVSVKPDVPQQEVTRTNENKSSSSTPPLSTDKKGSDNSDSRESATLEIFDAIPTSDPNTVTRGKSLGKHPTVKRSTFYFLGWSVTNPQEEIFLSCSNGFENPHSLEENSTVERISVPPQGFLRRWAVKYERCALQAETEAGQFRVLSSANIYVAPE